MATITKKLSVTGAGLTSNQLALTLSEVLTVTTPHIGLSKVSVPHDSTTDVVKAAETVAVYVYLRNMDTTNFVVLKNATSQVWGVLHPGESIMFAVQPLKGFEIQADTASCFVEYGYWTKG
tara:strand:- start:445 stop:807 length:363 start_codon:yes stop_codon:yes gene_type:complete